MESIKGTKKKNYIHKISHIFGKVGSPWIINFIYAIPNKINKIINKLKKLLELYLKLLADHDLEIQLMKY
jgi:hypothetical protein